MHQGKNSTRQRFATKKCSGILSDDNLRPTVVSYKFTLWKLVQHYLHILHRSFIEAGNYLSLRQKEKIKNGSQRLYISE